MTAAVETQARHRAADSVRALLPYEPQSAAAARRLVRAALRDWELGDLVEAGELIVSELAGNAAKTGCQRKMAVSVERITDGCVRISVRDGSRTLPCLIDAGPTAESGRGIAMVHHLTGGHWGTTPEPDGKTVHADLQLRPTSPVAHRFLPGSRGGAPSPAPRLEGLPMPSSTPQVNTLTRRLDHSVPDIAPEPEMGVESLTRRLDHSVPDLAPEGTEI